MPPTIHASYGAECVKFVIREGAVNLKAIRNRFKLSHVDLDGVYYTENPDGWSEGSDFKEGVTVTVTGATTVAAAAAQPPAAQPGPIVEQLQARLQQLEIANAIMWELFDYDDSNATSISVREFKESLLAAYSAQRDGSVGRLAFCMLTHKYLPKGTVIAAHLWKRAWSRFCNRAGFDNIDDVRNGLLLFKPIEWAFDNSKLSIVPNTTFNPPTFQAYLQDASLADVRLVDKLEELQGRDKIKVTDAELDYTRELLGDMTFGDVHQRNLRSDGRSLPDPFTRVLHFQYKRALRKAEQQGWQQPEGSPPSSHASPGAWHVQRMFDSLSHNSSQ